jgi:hypothetical protein
MTKPTINYRSILRTFQFVAQVIVGDVIVVVGELIATPIQLLTIN